MVPDPSPKFAPSNPKTWIRAYTQCEEYLYERQHMCIRQVFTRVISHDDQITSVVTRMETIMGNTAIKQSKEGRTSKANYGYSSYTTFGRYSAKCVAVMTLTKCTFIIALYLESRLLIF